MQSSLIFMAEFQMAKSRLLKNFELSDHGNFSQEPNDAAQGRDERFSSLNPGRAIRCMKETKLLRTEFYGTRSAEPKPNQLIPIRLVSGDPHF
jgi:hypothetical protein